MVAYYLSPIGNMFLPESFVDLTRHCVWMYMLSWSTINMPYSNIRSLNPMKFTLVACLGFHNDSHQCKWHVCVPPWMKTLLFMWSLQLRNNCMRTPDRFSLCLIIIFYLIYSTRLMTNWYDFSNSILQSHHTSQLQIGISSSKILAQDPFPIKNRVADLLVCESNIVNFFI